MGQLLQFKASVVDNASQVLDKIKDKTKGLGDEVKKLGEEQAKADQANNKSIGSLDSLASKYLGVTLSVTAITAALGVAVKAFAESDAAVSKLNGVLQRGGVFTEEYSKYLQDFALELQTVTGVSDEAILNVQSLLGTFGIFGERLDAATKAALDLNAVFGIDLDTSTKLLGKAFDGNAEALKKFGIVIDETVPKSQIFDATLAEIARKAGGASGDESLEKSFKKLGAELSNFVEIIGQVVSESTNLAGVFDFVSQSVNALFTLLGGGSESAQLKNLLAIKGVLADIFETLSKLPDFLGGGKFRQTFNELKQDQKDLTNLIIDAEKTEKSRLNSATKISSEYQKQRLALIAANEAAKKISPKEEAKEQLDAQVVLYEKIRQLRANNIQEAADAEFAIRVENENRLAELQIKNYQDNLGLVQSLGTGNLLSGATNAVAQTAGTGYAQIVAIAIQVLQNIKNLPKQIGEFLGSIIEGVVDGVPALLDYLSGPFITELVEKFLPALIKAGIASVGQLALALNKAVATLAKSLPSLVVGIGKGVIGGVVDTFKNIGSSIGAALGFGGDGPSPQEKLNQVIKELAETFKTLNDDLSATVKSIQRSLLNPDQLFAATSSDNQALKRRAARLRSDFREAGLEGNTEEAAKIAQKIADNQKEQLSNLQTLFKIENDNLDKLLAKETELFNTRLREQEEIKKVAETQIKNLESLKNSVKSAFDSVRNSIISSTISPEQNVSRLQAALSSAATPEARAAAAQALAGGLQGQFSAAQSLAASGAITGEEFQKIQADVLSQLNAAEAGTIDNFDRLINAQQEIIKRADNQIQILKDGFEAFKLGIDKQREDLKVYFSGLIQQLASLNVNQAGTTLSSWDRRAYTENIGNQKGVVRS